ncbi:MAG TPA: glycoside hydrolase family 32 protein, partial [Cyclobacteriaceae bacterium]|nr:glycoside hydrolase family 32 protein [Cyclobacteriaceae bacterium]
WGPMHWGHAISKDMIYWEHLPIALYPDSLGYIFSGSAVVDHQNTSGLGTKDNPPMVAMFTYHKMEGEKAGRNDYQTQGIAFSLDNGRSWTKYDKNPVLKNPGIKDFRDPKIFWYEASGKWILILAVQNHIELFESPDLKSWTKNSEFGLGVGSHGGVWECPDLFPLKVDGGEEKWVMLVSINPGAPNGGSGTQYFVGSFDGKKFVNDNPPDKSLWIDQGHDNYAGVTWSNIPASDGRRLFLGWMGNWEYAQVVPTYAWRSAMTLPREFVLTTTPAGTRLASRPVKEIESLASKSFTIRKRPVKGETILTSSEMETGQFELLIELDGVEKDDFSIELFNTVGEKLVIHYTQTENAVVVDRTAAGKNDFSPKFPGVGKGYRSITSFPTDVRLFVDQSSVEIFMDSGLLVMTETFFPSEPFKHVKIISDGIDMKTARISKLKRIW